MEETRALWRWHEWETVAMVEWPGQESKAVEKSAGLTQVFEQWDREVCEFEGVANKVTDVCKLSALRSLLATQLDVEIGRNATIWSYGKARSYMYDQIHSRRDAPGGKSKDANGWDKGEAEEYDDRANKRRPCWSEDVNGMGKGGRGRVHSKARAIFVGSGDIELLNALKRICE